MEEENNNMFSLENENQSNSVFDLPNNEEETIGIDIYDLNNKKHEYEFDIKKKAGVFLSLCLTDLGIDDPRNEIVMFAPRTKTYIDKEKTLEQNGIQSLDELYLRKNAQPIGSNSNSNVISNRVVAPPTISVIIVNFENKLEEFSIYPNITVRELLTAYSERVGVNNIDSMIVSWKGKNLNMEQKLSDVGVEDKDQLNLSTKLHGGLL